MTELTVSGMREGYWLYLRALSGKREKRYRLSLLVKASGLSEAALAREVGLSGTSLKWAREIGLVEAAADRYAVRAGLVPWLVWPDWLDDLELVCADLKCSRMFVPSRKGQRYCTVKCGRRAWDREDKRRRYAEDPEFAAAGREKARQYRERSLRAIRVKDALRRERTREERKAYMKAYYRANREVLLEKQRQRDRAKAAA